jgi:hypothetical protein
MPQFDQGQQHGHAAACLRPIVGVRRYRVIEEVGVVSIVEDEVYRLPLYTPPQAAHIVDVAPATLRNWVRGYAYKTLGGVVEAFPMITTARPGSSRGPSVPFLGLAEAYVLAAFRAVGVPMQRIRPAIEWLDQNIGLPAALASERLVTDGAEILFDFSRRSDLEDAEAARAIDDLVVVRNQQRVFVPVVSRYLRMISYRQGYVELIRLPQFDAVEVTVGLPLPGAASGSQT